MFRSPARLVLLACATSLVAACNESSTGLTPGADAPQLQLLDVAVSSPWELNRPIRFSFSAPVDFSTVSSTTIRIQTNGIVPARGSFAFDVRDTDGDGIPEVDRTTVVFQPTCPLELDLSDAGLQAGFQYLIVIPGGDSAAPKLRSEAGGTLPATLTLSFVTRSAGDPAALADLVVGPPVPVVRPRGSADLDATYIELGGDPDLRVYLERDPLTGDVFPNPSDFRLPLNLYSRAGEEVVFVLHFNQLVDVRPDSLEHLRVEYLDGAGRWIPLETRTEVVAGCAGASGGSIVRLVPRGVLPQGSEVRAVVGLGFRDVVGQVVLTPFDRFARVRTRTVAFQSLVPADVLGDELLEEFLFAADSPLSNEDDFEPLDGGRADWGGGALRASLGLDASGGPGGDFDWVVGSGETVFVSTTSTVITGGPGGLPVTSQELVRGRIVVRNLVVEEGGTMRVQGPFPLVVEASGSVIVRGRIDLSGFRGRDIASLNTATLPEPGGAGVAGGGRGGTGSPQTTTSSACGGTGEGPFGQVGLGGNGGESGFAARTLGKDARRPGGGGGGRFAPDVDDLVAEPGGDGHPLSNGAKTGLHPARGGEPNASDFADGDPTNDFYGLAPVLDRDGNVVDRIRGELDRPMAGYGGGAGGDAIPSETFPHPQFSASSDEKGGPGGGAGGQLFVTALGPIVFGAAGEIRCDGASGGTGENTLFLDHIGGTGGAGSGGHVVLQSASHVDFTGGDPLAALGDRVRAVGGPRRVGPSTGLPEDFSEGGAGGPGLVQLHVPGPERGVGASADAAGVVVPLAALGEADPLDAVTSPGGVILYPSIGSRSTARSRWIPLGAVAEGPAGPEPVAFRFGGVAIRGPNEGCILTEGTLVRDVAPLLGPDLLTGDARVEPDRVTLSLRGDALAFGTSGALFDDVYLRTPALLEHFRLRLERVDDTAIRVDHEVSHATYDDATGVLSITIVERSVDLVDFLEGDAAGTDVLYSLTPRFFRLSSRLGVDRLPADARVRILFQVATVDSTGRPDEDNLLFDWTADVERFNAVPNGTLDFFRFRVDLELDSQSIEPTSAPLKLDYLRLPFRF